MAHAGGVTRPSDPVLVTTAPKNPQDELRERQRRYLVTMGVRTVMFLLAIVFYVIGLHWAAVLTGALSLVLPWFAVVAANAGPKHTVENPSLYYEKRREIGSRKP